MPEDAADVESVVETFGHHEMEIVPVSFSGISGPVVSELGKAEIETLSFAAIYHVGRLQA